MPDLPTGPLLGVGRVAEVFAWGDDRALKLFREFMPQESVRYEQQVALLVQQTGLALAPAVGEMVQIEGRWGIIYERLSGKPMVEQLQRHPWLAAGLARQLADLHAAMHACSGAGLPGQHERLRGKVQAARPLPESLRQAVLQALEKLPQGNNLCHGDFHPGNVLLTKDGPRIIDWPDAACGNPLADVARTAWLLAGSALPPDMPLAWLVQRVREHFLRVYLQRYFELRPGGQEQLAAWRPVITAARLDEGIQEEQAALLKAAGQLMKGEQ